MSFAAGVAKIPSSTFSNAVNVPQSTKGAAKRYASVEVILGAGDPARGNEFVMKVVIRHSGPWRIGIDSVGA